MCENSEVRFGCRNFRFDLSNVKITPAGDHSRETAIEKTILRVPRARTFLHRLTGVTVYPVVGLYPIVKCNVVMLETPNNFRIRLADQGRNFPLDTVLLLT
jgi:hypothetical protein